MVLDDHFRKKTFRNSFRFRLRYLPNDCSIRLQAGSDFCAPSGTRRWIDHFEFVARQFDDASLVRAFGVRKQVAFGARDESVSRFVQ